ncbi:hypothetical protein [Pluralibacter sp.]|uniref:hypothetical protein n=1 Tax=Pluralibacter sp. TaxID=1920032 RepID=UPI0025F5D6F1|nr:hypothetical protein [Pluralibacter sp.]MBV8043316.1 helix-turn-helix domain-containing protein [Pluralibacter sp.]
MSRPTKYRDEFAEMALRLCHLGLTDAELGLMFGVDERTINRWKKRFPEFCLSIKRGKLVADAKVADALFQKATGYQHTEDDIRVINGEVVKTQTVRHSCYYAGTGEINREQVRQPTSQQARNHTQDTKNFGK